MSVKGLFEANKAQRETFFVLVKCNISKNETSTHCYRIKGSIKTVRKEIQNFEANEKLESQSRKKSLLKREQKEYTLPSLLGKLVHKILRLYFKYEIFRLQFGVVDPNFCIFCWSFPLHI